MSTRLKVSQLTEATSIADGDLLDVAQLQSPSGYVSKKITWGNVAASIGLNDYLTTSNAASTYETISNVSTHTSNAAIHYLTTEIDHTLIQNVGTNSHAQIDIDLVRLSNTSGTNTGDQDLSGYLTLDQSTRQTIYGSPIFAASISDASNVASVDVNNRIVYNSSGQAQLDYSGTTVAFNRGIQVSNAGGTGGIIGTRYLASGSLVGSWADGNNLYCKEADKKYYYIDNVGLERQIADSDDLSGYIPTTGGTLINGLTSNEVGSLNIPDDYNVAFAANAKYTNQWDKISTARYGVLNQLVSASDGSAGRFEVWTSAPSANPISNWTRQFYSDDNGNTWIQNNLSVGTTANGKRAEYGEDTAGNESVYVTNINSGTGSYAQMGIRNSSDYDNDSFRLMTMGNLYTTVGGFVQDSAVLDADIGLAGGMSIMTRANAPIRFYTNGHTNERMRILGDGKVGIGTDSPSNKLDVRGTSDFWASSTTANIANYKTSGGTTTDYFDAIGNLYINPVINGDTRSRSAALSLGGTWYDDGTSNPLVTAIDNILQTYSTKNANVVGINSDVRLLGSATYSDYGNYNPIIVGSATQVRTLNGVSAIINGEFVGSQYKIGINGGTFAAGAKIVGFQIAPPNYTAGTINAPVYGVRVGNQGNASWANSYGLYIDAQSNSTSNNYAIYSDGGKSYFAGNIGIGINAPDNELHLKATLNPELEIEFTDAGSYGGVRFDNDNNQVGWYYGGSTNTLNASALGLYNWGTSKYLFKLLESGNVHLNGDNYKLYFGAGQDASIYYDGTDMIISPADVGSGSVVVQNDGAVGLRIKDSSSTEVPFIDFVQGTTSKAKIRGGNALQYRLDMYAGSPQTLLMSLGFQWPMVLPYG